MTPNTIGKVMIAINRTQLFLLFTMLAFFAPLLFFWTSLTFIVVVPFTVLIWFAVRWQEIAKIENRSKPPEILLALGVYFANIARNALRVSETFEGIGLVDMLIAFVAICIAFYGVRSLRKFVLPTTYLAVLIVGYELEFAISEVASLQNFLANSIAAILNFLTITASATNNLITLQSRGGNQYFLLINGDCTGIKSMLAYGSLAILMIIDIDATMRRKLLWTALGVVGTFFVNVSRLLAIFLAAYFFEIDTAMYIHIYLGYSLFIVWILVFWTMAFKFMQVPEKKAPE